VSDEARAMLLELLTAEARHQRDTIREADLLSRPVEAGHWRWADISTDGYHRKTPIELADMYVRNQKRAAAARERLTLVLATFAELTTGVPA
jgi:hypothetical protein